MKTETQFTPKLKIRLFGPPEIHLNEALVTRLPIKTQALLFYLAVTQQAHPRTALASLLWGDLPERNARANLRKALQQLREALSDYLDLKQQSVMLINDDQVWVDVVTFEGAVNQVAASNPQTLEKAVQLYRGDFLAGFFVRQAPDFETWQLAQQARLRERMLEALQRLGQYFWERNDLAKAISASRRIIELEPWREEAQRQLMELLAQNGDRSAALKQYELCRQMLMTEFGDDTVSEATAQLYARILNDEIEPQVVETPTPVTPQPSTEAWRLPSDTIPDPGPLPPGSLMPLSKNPLFVGRESDLRALAQALTASDTAAVSQVETAATTGLGGIGKTQLACEFVHRYGQFFPGGVFWLSFDNAESIPAEIAACGGAGALELQPDFGKRPLDEQVRLVQSAWQAPLPRLLVFDNCEQLVLLTRWRPTSGGCRIIVTSRRGDWEREPTLGVQMLALGVLSRAESLTLLQSHRPTAEIETLDALAEELGDLPLALHLAGSYLRRYPHIAPAIYLAQLQDPQLLHHPSMQGGGYSPTGHIQHVGRTFALSYDRLDPQDETDARALKLLVHAAHFAPGEPIWYRLLIKTLELDLDEPDDSVKADAAFARLIELGIIEQEEATDTLRMHRLVARFVRDVDKDQIEVTQKSVEAIVFAETAQINQAGYPMPLLAWQLHLRTVVDIAQAREDEQSARLCSELGQHLWQIGDYESALPYVQKALDIREHLLDSDHLDTAKSLNQLGYLYHSMGKSDEALPCFEQALSIREKHLGQNHAAIAESLNYLGRAYLAKGSTQLAQAYFGQALEISRNVLGAEHPLTAEYENNVAISFMNLDQAELALPHLQQALKINEQSLGQEHPDTAMNLNNIALALKNLGRFQEAEPHFKRALEIRRQVLGDEHPDTGQAFNNLGSLFLALKDYQAARRYLEQALHIYEYAFPEAHPYTAFCLNNLGLVLQALKEPDQARSFLEQALSIRQQVLEDMHPLRALSHKNLGLLLADQEDIIEAQKHLRQALLIYEANPNAYAAEIETVQAMLTKLAR